MRWKYSLVLCLGIVLFLTVTACGNDQRTISKAAAEKTDIPVRYKKELEYLNFKIEHIDMDADKDLYQSCAKRVEFDPEKLAGYFLGSEFQKCIHIDENGMIYLTDENRSLLVNQDYLAYMSGSRLQTYVSENLPEWRNGGHMDSVCTYTEFTERPIQAEKSFLEKQLSGLGIQNLDFWKCYGMGMKQRLAVAQAIMEDQEVLLLDEPMNGLDNAGVEAMRGLFRELRDEGKTILLASHNKEDISSLCDHVYEMDAGKIKNVR